MKIPNKIQLLIFLIVFLKILLLFVFIETFYCTGCLTLSGLLNVYEDYKYLFEIRKFEFLVFRLWSFLLTYYFAQLPVIPEANINLNTFDPSSAALAFFDIL